MIDSNLSKTTQIYQKTKRLAAYPVLSQTPKGRFAMTTTDRFDT
jgi:hypothetical protein